MLLFFFFFFWPPPLRSAASSRAVAERDEEAPAAAPAAAGLVQLRASRPEGHVTTLLCLGLASLLAWRLARHAPNTFSMSVNDHGFELLSAEPVEVSPEDVKTDDPPPLIGGDYEG